MRWGLVVVVILAACARLAGAGEAPASSPQPPPCRAKDLRAELGEGDGAGGHAALGLEVWSTSSVACTVSSHPRLELLDRERRLLASSSGRPFVGRGSNPSDTVVLPPGSSKEDGKTDIHRGAVTSVAQGLCPGGVFPGGSTLWLAVETGTVRIELFERDLPFNQGCDQETGPPAGVPQLLIDDLWPTATLPPRFPPWPDPAVSPTPCGGRRR